MSMVLYEKNDKTVARKSNFGTMQKLLEQFKEQIRLAIPNHLTPERVIRVALSTISRNALLLDAHPFTVVACVVQASALGLEVNAELGHAYLVPFWNKHLDMGNGRKGGYECQLITGYKGLVKLARNSGDMKYVGADAVHEKDSWIARKGYETTWQHEQPRNGDRGAVQGYWGGYVLMSGGADFEYMTVKEIEEHRDKYSKGAYREDRDAGKRELQGPWKDSPEWMFRKTPLRRALKLAPLSMALEVASSLDDRAESGKRQVLPDVPDDLCLPATSEEDAPKAIEGTMEAALDIEAKKLAAMQAEGSEPDEPVVTEKPKVEKERVSVNPNPGTLFTGGLGRK